MNWALKEDKITVEVNADPFVFCRVSKQLSRLTQGGITRSWSAEASSQHAINNVSDRRQHINRLFPNHISTIALVNFFWQQVSAQICTIRRVDVEVLMHRQHFKTGTNYMHIYYQWLLFQLFLYHKQKSLYTYLRCRCCAYPLCFVFFNIHIYAHLGIKKFNPLLWTAETNCSLF